MEFSFVMGIGGAALLVVGAVIYGIGLQLFGESGTGYEWLFTAIAATIGGFIASEFIVGFRSWEPVVDGLATLPALIGGGVVGLIVAAGTRLISPSNYHAKPVG